MSQANPVEHFERASAFARRVIAGVRPDQWRQPTNCEWDVRRLVNHLVEAQYFAYEFAHGRLQTVEEFLAVRDQDRLGQDPLAAYDQATEALDAVFRRPGFLESTVTMPYMPAPLSGADFARQRTMEVLLHGWDLAHSTGQDDTLDPEVCAEVYQYARPMESLLRQSGAFGGHVDVPDGADVQTRLLALVGRQR